MAYIDSELIKRRQAFPSSLENKKAASYHEASYLAGQDIVVHSREHGGVGPSSDAQRQPATLGKIQEISLYKIDDGMAGLEPKMPKAKRIRLGPDGKPWRGRKRRGSDDVKRDSIVEELLRENRSKSTINLDLSDPDCKSF